MQKTLLDEFAMAALGALLSSNHKGSGDDFASVSYDMAECMMVERVKRMPALNTASSQKEAEEISSQRMPQGLNSGGSPNPFICPLMLRETISSMKGRKVTCSELFEKAYGRSGDTNELRAVGSALRGLGYQKTRSGGKDYFQL